MRRFLLLVFVFCAGASAAFSLWPRQLDGYLALFEGAPSVNSGVAVTVLAVLTLLLVALRVGCGGRSGTWPGCAARAWSVAGGLPAAAPYPPGPRSAWGPRPLR